jgi:hypothetical protein
LKNCSNSIVSQTLIGSGLGHRVAQSSFNDPEAAHVDAKPCYYLVLTHGAAS